MGKIKQLLIEKILEYYLTGNYTFNDIQNPKFRFKKNFDDLWEQRENKNDQWDSFVKFVLFDQKEKQYISERIMRLLYESQDTLGKHFVISTDTGKFTLPDRLSEFLRLRSLCFEFLRIYRKIMSRINFDYPQREFSGNHIKGRIDWNKTSRNSLGNFPTKFYTRSWVREFDTPENRLLLLCANWIKEDSAKILKTSFKEPLSFDEKDILIKIHDSLYSLISHFPFSDVTRQVRGLKNFSKHSPEIFQLRREVNKRILEGKIKNPQYGNLQKWIGQYFDLSPEGIIQSEDMFVVESMTSIDKLYEILIFLEFYVYLKNVKRCNPRLELYNSENYKIIFPIRDNTVELYHDKNFGKDDKLTPNWILTSKPDYTAIVDKKIVAVFDAKNHFRVDKKLQDKHTKYLKTQKGLKALKNLKKQNEKPFLKDYGKYIDAETVSKYFELYNLDQKLAVQYCEESIEKSKIENQTMNEEYKALNADANQRKTDATIKILSYVTNLDVNYGGLIFPKEEYKLFTYPNDKMQTPRFHNNLMVEHLRLDYDEETALATRDSTVELIYKAIEFGIKSQPNLSLINN